jgi:hypothetical protein
MVLSVCNEIALYSPKTRMSERINNDDFIINIPSSETNRKASENTKKKEDTIVDIFPSIIDNRVYFLFPKSVKIYEIDQNNTLKCIC